MEKRNRFVLLIFTFFVHLSCSSQAIVSKDTSKCKIDKDRALQIAFANGYERGLDSIKATLLNDTVWHFECYLCDDNTTQVSNTMDINCNTGKVEPPTLFSAVSKVYIGGKPRIYSEFPMGFEEKPVLKLKSQPYLLTSSGNEREDNISISNKNIIVFSYGFRKIGIINIDGSGFKQICEECLYPQWVNNDVIAYFKDFEHVYEFNINTLKESRLTTEPYRYDVFTVSPDNKWLAYLREHPHTETDSQGNITPIVQTCTSSREFDLWIINVLDPTIQKKVNSVSADIYDPVWTENGDSLLFYNGESKYFASNPERERITCSKLKALPDIKLTNYKKMKKGLFPAITDCKIVTADYTKRSVKNILINERGRYRECVFSNDQRYLIYTKLEKKQGDPKIWILDLTK